MSPRGPHGPLDELGQGDRTGDLEGIGIGAAAARADGQ